MNRWISLIALTLTLSLTGLAQAGICRVMVSPIVYHFQKILDGNGTFGVKLHVGGEPHEMKFEDALSSDNENVYRSGDLVFRVTNDRFSLERLSPSKKIFSNVSCPQFASQSSQTQIGETSSGSEAVAVVGPRSPQDVRPLPPGPEGTYTFPEGANFQSETRILNPANDGLACEYNVDTYIRRCSSEAYYIVDNHDYVQLNLKKTGQRFLLPKQNISNCTKIDPACERLYAISPQDLSVGLGFKFDYVNRLQGVQIFITRKGTTEHLQYLEALIPFNPY